MKRRTFLAGVVAVTAGCADVIPEQESSPPPPDSEDWAVRGGVEGSIGSDSHQNLVLRDHDFAATGGHARVRGTIRNTRDEAFPGVEVDVTLFTEADDEIETASAERDEPLDPEGTWQFAVTFDDVDVDSVARYEVNTGGESPL